MRRAGNVAVSYKLVSVSLHGHGGARYICFMGTVFV